MTGWLLLGGAGWAAEGRLDGLVAAAEDNRTDMLVIWQGGEPVLEWTRRGRPEQQAPLMSVTKSIVSLALGPVLEEHDIDLDTPLRRWFPGWAHGEVVTLRHVLTHTSGLDAERTTGEVYAARSAVEHALALPLRDPPGTAFFYNNAAVNLLGRIVAEETGKPLDVYVDELLFTPLGIEGWRWGRDKLGEPYTMANLQMTASGLARIGELVRLGGEGIVSTDWIARSTAPVRPWLQSGLLWWPQWGLRWFVDDALLDLWDARAVPLGEAEAAAIRGLRGQRWEQYPALAAEVQGILGGEMALRELRAELYLRGLPVASREPYVYSTCALGDLGQQLCVFPAEEAVAVRLRQADLGYVLGREQPEAWGWPGFPRDVRDALADLGEP